jgi:hypothetical protein
LPPKAIAMTPAVHNPAAIRPRLVRWLLPWGETVISWCPA